MQKEKTLIDLFAHIADPNAHHPPNGTPGLQGPTGPAITGPQGVQGVTGPGYTGPQGVTGPGPVVTGPPGVTGIPITGPQGVTGLPITGPPGVTGIPITGPQGVTGLAITGPAVEWPPASQYETLYFNGAEWDNINTLRVFGTEGVAIKKASLTSGYQLDIDANTRIDGALFHDGSKLGFFGTSPQSKDSVANIGSAPSFSTNPSGINYAVAKSEMEGILNTLYNKVDEVIDSVQNLGLI